jgi:hypothetical protein
MAHIASSIRGEAADSLATYLREQEQALGVPIRVINGRGSAVEPGSPVWSTGATADAVGNGFENPNSTGITIASMACLTPAFEYQTITLPGEHWVDPATAVNEWGWSNWAVGDCPVPAQSEYERVEAWGLTLGERHDRTIALHIHVSTLHPEYGRGINWDQMLGQALTLCIDEEARAHAAEARRARDLERFVAVASRQSSAEINRMRNEIDHHIGRVTEGERLIRENAAVLREKQEILDAVLTRRESTVEDVDMEAEWASIARHADVEELRWQSEYKLDVLTKELDITHPNTGDTTTLGKFRLTLDFQERAVYANNLTNRKGVFDHPHVREGEFCHGDLAPTIAQLMREYQIGAAVALTCDSLHIVTPEDDWGRHIEWWFDESQAPFDE